MELIYKASAARLLEKSYLFATGTEPTPILRRKTLSGYIRISRSGFYRIGTGQEMDVLHYVTGKYSTYVVVATGRPNDDYILAKAISCSVSVKTS